MNDIDFPQWLIDQMNKVGITQADLSKSSGLSSAAISLILSSSRGVGSEACVAIAKALKLPPETVFRAAGILPPAPKKDARKEMILHLAEQLPDEEYEDLVAYIEMRIRRAKEKGKYPDATANPKPAG